MLNINPTMTIAFVFALALTGCLMKLLSLLPPPRTQRTRWLFLLSPLVSPNSLKRSKPLNQVPRLLRRTLVATVALPLFYFANWQLQARFGLPAPVRSYLGIPGVCLLGELLGCSVGLFWSWSGRVLPGILNEPWQARGIADFWGNRWNLWFSDWFRFVIFNRLRHRPVVALFAVFGVSGLMHEWVVNLPLFLLTGTNLFGSMMAYFLLQAAGALLERRISKTRSGARRSLAWLVVFIPAPLVINEGLLRAVWLWQG